MTSKTAKHSVAVVIRNGSCILAVRRPLDDDELPGIWGLPAGTFRESETIEELVARIGEQKLGVRLRPSRRLAQGVQSRPAYILHMELWETEMEGTPRHTEWQWADSDILEPGRAQGSLCCDLALGVL